MKKILFIFAGLMTITSVRAADIDIYFLPTCPHCHHLMEYIDGDFKNEMPEITVEKFDLSDTNNHAKFKEMLLECKFEGGGVPAYVIKGKCFQGYGSSMNSDIMEAAKAENVADAQKKTNRIWLTAALIFAIGALGLAVMKKRKA